jgi:hypothetical protein
MMLLARTQTSLQRLCVGRDKYRLMRTTSPSAS